MKKRNLVVMFGLAVAMMFSAAPKAHAGVIVGVRVGAPVYVHPARAFYAGPRIYVAPRPFVTVAPYPVYRSFYGAPRSVAFRHVYVRHEYVRRGYNGWRR